MVRDGIGVIRASVPRPIMLRQGPTTTLVAVFRKVVQHQCEADMTVESWSQSLLGSGDALDPAARTTAAAAASVRRPALETPCVAIVPTITPRSATALLNYACACWTVRGCMQ